MAEPQTTSMFGVYSPYNNRQPIPRTTNPYDSGIPGAYGLYNTAIEQQAGDYGNIMKGYQNLSSSPGYQNLANLAQTGGYSDADIANVRERSISPIRSIYASANRDVDRQRALQGGYSPNYNAVKAKMARELSDTIANKTTDVNATLAQNIAQNKIGLAPAYQNQAEAPLKAQQSLYGTTPALSSLFGNQALNAAQLQNQINQAPAISPSTNSSFSTGGIRPSSSILRNAYKIPSYQAGGPVNTSLYGGSNLDQNSRYLYGGSNLT